MAIVEQVHIYYHSNNINGEITLPPGVTVKCEDSPPDDDPFTNNTSRATTIEHTLPPTQEYFSKFKIFHTASGTPVADANIHFYLDGTEVSKDYLTTVYATGDVISLYHDFL